MKEASVDFLSDLWAGTKGLVTGETYSKVWDAAVYKWNYSQFDVVSQTNYWGHVLEGSLPKGQLIYDATYNALSYSSMALAPEAGGLFTRTLSSIRFPVYRVFGGGISGATGEFWSLINPRLYGSFYRNFAGLPDWNTAAFQVRGSVTLGDIFKFGKVRPASPFHGNYGRLVPELRINPSRVKLTHYNGFKID